MEKNERGCDTIQLLVILFFLSTRILVATVQKRRNIVEHTDLCCRCRSCPETLRHVLCCQDLAAIQVWEPELGKLETWMTSTHTDPTLYEGIINSLASWHDQGSSPDTLPSRTLLDGINSSAASFLRT